MSEAWVLVANSSEARLFRHAGKQLELVEEYLHPDSRRKDREIASDHLGHEEHGGTRAGESPKTYGSFPEPTDPQEHEFDRFARELAHALDHHRTENHFRELVVVAPPHFHGLFNRHVPDSLAKCITHHIEKDYTDVPERELPDRLAPHLH